MKTIKIIQLSLLLIILMCPALVSAQNPCETERFNDYSADIEKAKQLIVEILNGKEISVSDSLGKISYKEAKVFDDRIEFLTKKDVRVFFFRDMFYTGDKNEITVFCSKKHFKKG